MLRSVRVARILRELRLAPGRTLAMVAAVTVGAVAVGSALGAYAILAREIRASYLGTHPASATLELEVVDRALVDEVRARDEVADAEARATVLVHVATGTERAGLLLFVVDDFEAMRIARFAPVSGAWPPPTGTMLVERSAVGVLEADVGDAVAIRTPAGATRELRISGLVHDPSLAPAWMEQTGYGYVTPATLAWLGERGALDELRVVFEGDDTAGVAAIEGRARSLAQGLEARGHRVHEIRVPPPRMHPHEGQMRAILVMLAMFGAVALVLAAALVASMLTARLASQTREIGILKAIGATTSQVAAMSAALVSAIGATAALVAIPVGTVVARAFASNVATMLNFEIASDAIPAWVPLLQGAAAVLVPLALAAIPIARASRSTVRDAIDASGARAPAIGSTKIGWSPPWLGTTWRLAVRNAFRRRGWVAVTATQLALGGATFVTAVDVSEAWNRWADEVNLTRRYELEVLLRRDEPVAATSALLRAVSGVREVEAWGYAPLAVSRGHRHAIVRTYPDGGHGSFRALAPPAGSTLVDLPLIEGRTYAGPSEATLNQLAQRQSGAGIGDVIAISIEGRVTELRVTGIVRDVGSPATVYLSPAALSLATGTRNSARLFRIDLADGAEGRGGIARAPRALEERGIAIERVIPREILRTAIGDHVGILVVALLALALAMASVGAIGLASSTATQIVERTREIGVLRAIGAAPSILVRLLVSEGIVIGALGGLVGVLLAAPLSMGVGVFLGTLSFGTPLPTIVSPAAIAGWMALVLLVSAIATAIPAWRATRTSVREALGAT